MAKSKVIRVPDDAIKIAQTIAEKKGDKGRWSDGDAIVRAVVLAEEVCVLETMERLHTRRRARWLAGVGGAASLAARHLLRIDTVIEPVRGSWQLYVEGDSERSVYLGSVDKVPVIDVLVETGQHQYGRASSERR